MNLNILLLGGAKRVSMARMLIDAGHKRGIDVGIYSYELTELVPVSVVGTALVGRRWNDPEIYKHLREVADAYHIGAMVPFVDGAVGVAAKFVRFYDDVYAPVSSPELAETFFDKCAAATAFEEAGLPVPQTYRHGKPTFPLIAKPRHGSASKGIEIIESVNEFRRIISERQDYLIQTYYPERDEYTVDCFVGRDGRILSVSPRQRMEVVGGEVINTMTIDDPEIVACSRQALAKLGLRGAVTIQFLRDRESGKLMIMEINPRFGGGCVCSVHAGADLPGMVIDEAAGLSTTPTQHLRSRTLMTRYFQEVVFQLGS